MYLLSNLDLLSQMALFLVPPKLPEYKYYILSTQLSRPNGVEAASVLSIMLLTKATAEKPA